MNPKFGTGLPDAAAGIAQAALDTAGGTRPANRGAMISAAARGPVPDGMTRGQMVSALARGDHGGGAPDGMGGGRPAVMPTQASVPTAMPPQAQVPVGLPPGPVQMPAYKKGGVVKAPNGYKSGAMTKAVHMHGWKNGKRTP